jgi:hypothetical protein
VAAHKDEFDSVHSYLLENALFLLISFSRAFISTGAISNIDLIQDYVDTFQRLSLSCQSLDLTASSAVGRREFFRDMFAQMTQLANHLSRSIDPTARSVTF